MNDYEREAIQLTRCQFCHRSIGNETFVQVLEYRLGSALDFEAPGVVQASGACDCPACRALRGGNHVVHVRCVGNFFEGVAIAVRHAEKETRGD